MQITQHWLNQAQRQLSPNYDARPDPDDISLLVIHSISLPPGKYAGGYIQQLFNNTLAPETHPYFEKIYQLRVSSHLLIDRKGEISQFVPFDARAWHAGQSNYDGREKCNDFSIGVELEGTDNSPFTLAQYRQLATLTKALFLHYPKITSDRITGHSDIAPGRKTDPGTGFDWSFYYRLINQSPNKPADINYNR